LDKRINLASFILGINVNCILDWRRLFMVQNINELKKQIEQKNQVLAMLCHERCFNREKIDRVMVELDSLLYYFYKTLKSCV